VLLVLSAVAVEDPAILDLVIVDGEEFGSFDADSVDGDTKVAMEVGLAAPVRHEPAFPLNRRLDHDGRLAVDRDVWCLNLQPAEHGAKL
jgi:hypothetical protein